MKLTRGVPIEYRFPFEPDNPILGEVEVVGRDHVQFIVTVNWKSPTYGSYNIGRKFTTEYMSRLTSSQKQYDPKQQPYTEDDI